MIDSNIDSGTVEEFGRGEAMDVIRHKFEEGVRKDDPERMLVWAGSSVGLMKEIKPAKVRPLYHREVWPPSLNHRPSCKSYTMNVLTVYMLSPFRSPLKTSQRRKAQR